MNGRWVVLGEFDYGMHKDEATSSTDINTLHYIAKVGYFNPSFAFVLSPQGDIAFSDESEITTTNAWVWPVTAGLRVSF